MGFSLLQNSLFRVYCGLSPLLCIVQLVISVLVQTFIYLPQAHFLVGLGGVTPLPPHLQGSMIDFGSAPNDPLFIIHHTMMDCILEEWTKRHPSSSFPDGPLVRDGHKKSDYLRTFFPPITHGEVFTDPKEFGYYCQLPNLDINTPVGKYAILHCPLVTVSYLRSSIFS